MKKLSLLLALMLVLTTCVLAACGGDDETSKPNINVNVNDDDESSTPADDSSEASSTPDASSNPESSDPSTESSTPDDEPALPDFTGKTNIASGLEYTYPTNDAGTHGARKYVGNLTDGVIPEKFMDGDGLPMATWFGLFNNIGAINDTNAVLGYGEFVFNLGSSQELAGVQAYVGWSAEYEAVALTVYVSNDGSNWTEAGEMVKTNTNIEDSNNGAGVYTYGINLTGASQYVKVKMTCPGNTYWSFIGEVEIYA